MRKKEQEQEQNQEQEQDKENAIVKVQEKASVQTVLEQVNIIQELYAKAMKEGVDYGVIPGCDKPSLLKPGAEKITFMFRLRPNFWAEKEWLPTGHLIVTCKCELLNPKGEKLGEGVGMCSTLEKKYRWRNANRKCPHCGKETIYKSKNEDGGWYCWAKKGGCGKQFEEKSHEIINQIVGKVENDNIADEYNTVLKIAKKRAYIDATLTVSGVSDLFTQDMEEKSEAHTDTVTKTNADDDEYKKEVAKLQAKAKELLTKLTDNMTKEERSAAYFSTLKKLGLPEIELKYLGPEALRKLIEELEKGV